MNRFAIFQCPCRFFDLQIGKCVTIDDRRMTTKANDEMLKKATPSNWFNETVFHVLDVRI